MKKVVLGVLGAGVVAVAALVGVIATQPAQVHIERSQQIAASPEDIWPYVSDLRGFVKWSPWEARDPNQVATFSDPSSGVGAWYGWKGNEDVGSGKMTITAAETNTKVVEDLEFIEPFESKAVVTLTITPVDGGSQVTWGFDGENDFMGKAFSLVVDMDTMLGGDFAAGLTSLSALAEADAKARAESERLAAEAAAAEEAAAAAVATP